ncbi:MAG: alpha/beta fold hydrolase [Bryobacteraceae bacterium]|nr:alpha/beta fold hydrolase [Bryobacteraceae bacterium]
MLQPATPTTFTTEPGVQVMAMTQSPAGSPRGELIILHGLEGSHDSGYMRSLAHAALAQGYRTHRLNMRSCGGTELLSPTLYHAGLTSDLRAILEQFHREGRGPVFVAGFSLGGNVVLKLLGELGTTSLVAGGAAISTPLDLEACCRRMMEPRNRLYESRFVTRLKERYRQRHQLHPEHYRPHRDRLALLDQVRTVMDFDDQITAPYFGFGTATNYYATQSSGQYLPRIAVPTLVVQAQDDPLIPYSVYRQHDWVNYGALWLVAPAHGGHVGFLARQQPRFWVDHTILDFFAPLRNN